MVTVPGPRGCQRRFLQPRRPYGRGNHEHLWLERELYRAGRIHVPHRDARRSAEDQAMESLPDNEIKAAMQALPEQFRIAVYYADVEGFRCKEIAAIMNIPHGPVMSRLHRGRQQLRSQLGAGNLTSRRKAGGDNPLTSPST
jgi:DNA-directed RNA polymerase specialized sigma24 family protein